MPIEDLILTLGVLIVGGSLLRPIARAFAERLRGGRVPDADLQALREEVLSELQQTRRELTELGERLDFAERLLARPRDHDHRPAGP